MRKPTALVRVIERHRPYSGDSIGRYLQIALPNEAANAFGRVGPSFEYPYKLRKDSLIMNEADILRVLTELSEKFELIPYTKE